MEDHIILLDRQIGGWIDETLHGYLRNYLGDRDYASIETVNNN